MAKLNFPSSPSNGTLYTENGNIWRWNGTSWVSYNSLDLTSQTTGALGATNGGTGLTSYTVGDVLYANTSSTVSKIAAGTAGSVLASAGAGNTPYYADPNVLVTSSSGTTSRNVNVTTTSSNSTHYLAFTLSSGTVAGAALSSGIALTYNPNTATFYATNINAISGFSGNLTGFANTSRNVDVQLATTNATHLITFTPSLTAVTGSATSSDGTLVYNPSSKILTTSGLAITSSTVSTGSTNGALVVTGGVGIGDSLFVAGNISVNSGTNGLLLRKLVAGNFGAIYSTNITPSTTNYSFITDGASVSLNGTNGVYLNISNTNKIQITSNNVNIVPTADSTSTTTGALTVAGGVGIGGSLYVTSATGISGVIINAGVVTGSLTGNVTGFATTGRNLNTVAAGNSNVAHLLLFSTASGTVSGAAISNDTTFSFNPSTEILSVSGIAVTAGTASTNSATGALRVSGGLGVSGQLSFNTASLGSTGYSNPSIIFSASASSAPITLTVQSDNTLSWEGTSGQLFAIDNNLTTGDIFSVSDISGLPIINASAGQTVSINEFGGFTRIGNGTISSSGASNANADGSLVVYGGIGITGNANIGGTVRITNTTASTGNTSGSLVVSGGAAIGLSLFVGGNLNLTGTLYSGSNTFTKTQNLGDIALDNGTVDTPAVTFYWGNNRNIGIDAYYSGSGTTRFRITKELNEAGGTELWSVDRNGIVTQSAWDVGEVINTRVYNNTDLNMSATTTINSTTYTNVATITYTPKSTTSHLWIEFDANYDFSNGTTTDDFFSRITVGGTAIVEKNQIMVGQVGGGTRSGTIFPISGRYTNTTTSGIAITVQAKWGSADDNIRVYGSSTSGYMRIQEIGR